LGFRFPQTGFQYPLEDAETFVRLIAARATIVQISGELKICRDPDDDEIWKRLSSENRSIS
jgi:hypothetical protein